MLSRGGSRGGEFGFVKDEAIGVSGHHHQPEIPVWAGVFGDQIGALRGVGASFDDTGVRKQVQAPVRILRITFAATFEAMLKLLVNVAVSWKAETLKHRELPE